MMTEMTFRRSAPTTRRWLGPLLAAVVVASVACGGGDGDSGAPTPAPAATETPAAAVLDEKVALQLQQVLDAAVANPDTGFPGAILFISGPGLGTWAGAAGLGEISPQTPMRVDDKFRAGSIVKTFVAVVVLQLIEEGTLSLDDTLPDVLPPSVHSRFPEGDRITVRMLLNHTSGLPEWLVPAVIAEIATNPRKVWNVAEFLDLSAEQPRSFTPGARYAYSNTDYTLLGEIIEAATGRSWRDEVNERVIRPLGLQNTVLPQPGDVSIPGDHAHGYGGSPDVLIDLTGLDPSMAGAAGAAALVTTVSDLVLYWKSLSAGSLFDDDTTLREMLSFVDAPDEGGQVGYGLGVQRYVLPDGSELIGHLGGSPGYMAFVGHVSGADVTIAAAVNTQRDPSPVLLPVVEVLTAATR